MKNLQALIEFLTDDLSWAGANVRVLDTIADKVTLEWNNMEKYSTVILIETMPSQSNAKEIKDAMKRFDPTIKFAYHRGLEQSRLAFHHKYFVCIK